jgi:hypothetical protein
MLRRKKFIDEQPIAILLDRERLGIGRYRKVRERDPEKRRMLIELALEKIREAERLDYQPAGFRRRKVKG